MIWLMKLVAGSLRRGRVSAQRGFIEGAAIYLPLYFEKFSSGGSGSGFRLHFDH